ncbi:unnamed protein product [Onchocerca flexuosa]|uniref:Bestrophin homolog n=1 Tax=Onchocerca flexuosa TaxID=387005 RepID=A0A183H2P4_9BILA|nr:unnamed protein product [Onchocerca flexuosa]
MIEWEAKGLTRCIVLTVSTAFFLLDKWLQRSTIKLKGREIDELPQSFIEIASLTAISGINISEDVT